MTLFIKRALDPVKDAVRAVLNLLLRPVYSYLWWCRSIYPGDGPRPELRSARRIVVIRPDEIGDFILTSSFLRELRRNAPQARITLVIKKSLRSMAEVCPYVDEIIIYDWEKHSGRSFFPLHFRAEAVRAAREIARGEPDLILLPRRDYDMFESELLAHAAARTAAVAKCRSESSYYTGFQNIFPPGGHVFENSRREHEVTHMLRFLTWLGGTVESDRLETWTSPEDEVFAAEFLTRRELAAGSFLVMHPSGGRSHLKQWPRERFELLLEALQDRFPALHCLVVGGPDEPWIGELLPSRDKPRVVNSAGALNLRQLAAVLRKAGAFVGGDTGPMHLAAAAGVPVVALFGSTHLDRYRPHTPRAEVVTLEMPCSPAQVGSLLDRCWRCIYLENRCLTDMPVEAVFARLVPVVEKFSR